MDLGVMIGRCFPDSQNRGRIEPDVRVDCLFFRYLNYDQINYTKEKNNNRVNRLGKTTNVDHIVILAATLYKEVIVKEW